MGTQHAMTEPPPLRRLAVGAQVRAARRHAAMSQKELAAAVGMSQRTVSAWECGHAVPDLIEWVLIAEATDTAEMLNLGALAPTLSATDREITVEQPQLPGFRSHLFAVN